MKKVSIIIPVFNNEKSLRVLVDEIFLIEQRISHISLEIIFVDDGSSDNSLKTLLDIQTEFDTRDIKVIKLARNFGAVSAERAGFKYASGDCVGLLSADLQDPPNLFEKMIPLWLQGAKVVFALRTERSDSRMSMLFSWVYYRILQALAFPNYPDHGFDIFLVDREVVNQLDHFPERNLQFQPLFIWMGYSAAFISYSRASRKFGKSGWTFMKRLKMATDVILGFSYVPVRLMSLIGIFCAFCGLLYGLLILGSIIYFGVEVRGYGSLMATLLFVSGIQMTMMGILGEYLWRTLDEAKRRPPYVVDEVHAKNTFLCSK